MKPIEWLKSLVASSIDKYFTSSRLVYVPVVKGGMLVDHDTALSLSAVFAAVRYISETIASLPWELRQRRKGGGSDPALTHNVYRLLHGRPNPEMGAFNWRMFMLSMVNLWGNAYAEIERDTVKRPVALWPIHPNRVEPKRENGQLYYSVDGGRINLMPDDIYHISGLGNDGIKGYSVVSLAARSIGAGLAADEFAASFFENGVVTSGNLKHPKKLGDKAYERLKKEFKEKHGGPKNAWKPLILEEGMEWQTMTMPLKDAEFLASRKFTTTEIARWFRVPPHKIADLEYAHFNNIEHLSIEVVQDTLIPWNVRLEQEANYKLISSRTQNLFYSKINVNGLLRGDSKARAEYYQKMRNMGAINSDEIRALEEMNPIPGGDKYVMQGQYTTLENIGKELMIKPSFDEQITDAWRPVFFDVLNRVYTRKKNRIADAKKNMQKDKLNDWLESCNKDHSEFFVRSIRPVLVGFGQSVGITDSNILEKCLNKLKKSIQKADREFQPSEKQVWSMVDIIQREINGLKE